MRRAAMGGVVCLQFALWAALGGSPPVWADEPANAPPPGPFLSLLVLPEGIGEGCTTPQVNDERLQALPLPEGWRPLRDAFLQGLCDLAGGRWQAAEQRFRGGLEAGQAAPALWRWHLVLALAGQQRHEAAAEAVAALMKSDPETVVMQRVRAFLTGLLETEPPLPGTVREEYLKAYFIGRQPMPEDYPLLKHWDQLVKTGGTPSLKAKLELMMWSHPLDRTAAEVWAGLPGRLAARKAPAPPEEAYRLRAQRLFKLGRFKQLTSEYQPKDLPQFSGSAAKRMGRLYFRALIRARQLSRAAVEINTPSVVRRFSFDKRQQLIWAIRIQLRRRRIGPVLKHLEALEALSPKDDALPGIFLELVRYNQGRKDAVTMNHWYQRLVKEYPETQAASDAYWFMAWNAFANKSFQQAASLLDEALQAAESFHPVDQARLYYWKGRLRLLNGDREGGEDVWREMQERWPYGYYAAMAELFSNGGELALNHEHNGAPPATLELPTIEALWGHPPFSQGLFLFSVADNDQAVDVLHDSVTAPLPPDVLEEASHLFSYLGQHHLQLHLVANHHLTTMRKNQVTDTPFWRRAFPLAHWPEVRRQAEQLGLDPFFVMAVMREESRFFTGADSTAGAKGLMQLMPSTARQVARQAKLEYDESHLHSPEVNISLGSHYLKRVLRRFENNPLYAAAAYNAGPGNLKRWRRRFGKLPLDVFVERIPFQETQNYVKRVFLSYTVYNKIYR